MEFPDHFVQVGDTRLIQGLPSQESMSFILPRVGIGPFSGLTLEPYLVVVDSPRDPVTPGTVKLAALASNDNNVGVTTPTR